MNDLVEAAPPKAFLEASVVAGATPKALVPTTFEGVFRMAQVIAASGMAPKDMGRPETITVAIMSGLEIGLTPMQAVQSIAVVNGRPTVWGDAAKALCLSSPLCDDITETLTGEGDKMVATCVAKRKGKSASTYTFSVENAKKANLWGKSGPWTQYPERMLRLRARAFALRDAFPDVLRGVSIREEVDDIPENARDVTPPSPPPAPTSPPAAPVAEAEIIPPKTVTADPPKVTAETVAARIDDMISSDAMEDPNAIISEIIDTLATASTPETVEEGYVFIDPEARLAQFDGYVERARAIKAQHIERTQALVAKASRAAKRSDAQEPPAATGSEPPPASSGGQISAPAIRPAKPIETVEDYVTYFNEVAMKFTVPGMMTEWWNSSKDLRFQLEMPGDVRADLLRRGQAREADLAAGRA